MSISLYSGVPGSGKSYHAVQDIILRLKRKAKNGVNVSRVISNFSINTNDENFILLDNSELNINFFIDFARENHVQRVEAQTLVIIDEAQIIFNSRDWNSNSCSRMDWIKFFSQHRKYGFNFILIAQFDRMLDRQIRSLIEYEVKHLKMSNFFKFLPFTTFIAITYWYSVKMKMGHDVVFYRRKIADYYNTFDTFDTSEKTEKNKDQDKSKSYVINVEHSEESASLPDKEKSENENINYEEKRRNKEFQEYPTKDEKKFHFDRDEFYYINAHKYADLHNITDREMMRMLRAGYFESAYKVNFAWHVHKDDLPNKELVNEK